MPLHTYRVRVSFVVVTFFAMIVTSAPLVAHMLAPKPAPKPATQPRAGTQEPAPAKPAAPAPAPVAAPAPPPAATRRRRMSGSRPLYTTGDQKTESGDVSSRAA